MAKLTRTEIVNSIETEFEFLRETTKLRIVNDYNDANHYELFRENTQDNLVEFFNNSLSEYFEYLEHSSDTYNQSDRYFRLNGQGWLSSFDDIEDEVDSKELADFIYDNWDEYEAEFDDTVDLIEENEEEEEEE